ncbi:MAG: hypothetical protein AB7S83_05805 [Candidatus Methanomethylophilaceae archaeon]
MRAAMVIFVVLAALGAVGITVDEVDAEPIALGADASPMPLDEPAVLGISALDGRSLRLAVSEGSVVAYPTIEWHLILPAAATVDAADSAGAIVSGPLAAGHYIFERTYDESTSQSITWTIDGKTTVFLLSIVRSSSAAIDVVDPGDSISIDPGELVQLEREVAIGCILLVIAPSPFLIAFWKRRKDRGWSDAFDE